MTRWWMALLCLVALPALAQLSDAPGPVGGAPARLPEIKLPDATELRMQVPRPVRAATAALGLGRQRLALVVGIGTIGSRQVLDTAPRDTLAVATALRSGGFVVMLREDLTSADLRATLREFRTRLQPGGVGLVYVTGLGIQLEGQNLLLPRETQLDATLAPEAQVAWLRIAGVPLAEMVDALMSSPDSPRMLVVDAAYLHPALAGLPKPGLAEQKLAPGVMALFGDALAVAQEVPAVAALPQPAPTDPREIAATRFARALVGALATPRISGPEALRVTQRAIVAGTLGQTNPWIAGETDAREELAEASLLDGLVPSTPEDVAREGLNQLRRVVTRPGAARAGEQSVADVLQQSAASQPAVPSATAPADNTSRLPAQTARPLSAQPPTAGTPALGNAASALGSAASTAGTATSVVGTVAGVAATGLTVVAGLSAAPAAAVSAATTAVSAVGSLAGNAVAQSSRTGSASAAEPPARLAVRQAAAQAPVPAAAALAPPTAPAAAPASSTHPRTARHAEGGERPLYTPRSNNFGYTEGDTYTYRVIDTWKDQITGSYTTAIEEVLANGNLLANGQQVEMDPQGRIKSRQQLDGAQSWFEPYEELWWSKPRRGENRSVNYKETFLRADHSRGEVEWDGSSSVGRPRKIQTPAGEFEVLPIETSGWYYEKFTNGARNSGQFSRTVWYSPKLGHPVAIDMEDADRMGKLLKRQRVELMHVQQARGTP